MRDVFDIWIGQSIMQAYKKSGGGEGHKRILTRILTFCANQLKKKHHPMKHHPHASKDERAMRGVGL